MFQISSLPRRGTDSTGTLAEELAVTARAKGALGVWPAHTQRMPVRAWVRLHCQYGCPDYGRWLTCPPYSPSLEFSEQLLGEYRTGLWISAPDHAGVNVLLRGLRKVAFDAGQWKAFALGAGHCDLCEACELGGCRHPKGAFPSLEALGVSVLEALDLHGIDPWPQGRLDCYGVLLLE